MSKVRKSIVSLMLQIGLASAACAAGPLDCETVWSDIGELRAAPAPVWMTPQVPGDGVIEEFVLTQFFRGDETYVAQSLAEAVCILERMPDQKTRNAIRLGLADFVSAAVAGSAEARYEHLTSSIDARLNDLFVQHGMRADTGILYIRTDMAEQFGVRYFGGVEFFSPIQREALAQGIRSPNLVLALVWVEYLEQLGVPGFSGDEFVKYFQELDLDTEL